MAATARLPYYFYVTIADNLTVLRSRIAAACERAGRDPAGITLIGASSASKGVSVEDILDALDAGLTDFGENYAQELTDRIEDLAPDSERATWHFIGHLQRNKVQEVLNACSIIHGVDSIRLAETISLRADAPVRLFLEVNVAAEASKYGFVPADVSDAVTAVGKLPNIDLVGLMAMAPRADTAEDTRPVFQELRRLAEANGLSQLSMGMTDDFEVAIEEGATMIRLGRAIFQGD